MKINGVFIGAILGLLAVIFGAFGAHLLKDNLSANALNSFETGVRFQMYHAIVILVLGIATNHLKIEGLNVVMLLMFIGVILFSGSIYLLSTREFTQLNGIGFLGPITPVGGLLLIISWALLAWKGLNASLS